MAMPQICRMVPSMGQLYLLIDIKQTWRTVLMGWMITLEGMPKYSIGAWLCPKSDGLVPSCPWQVDNHYNVYLALERYPVGSSHRFRYLHRNPPGNSGGIDAYSTNSLNNRSWYYINAIHDGSVNALFVNGEKVSEVSVTDSFPVTSVLLHVGVCRKSISTSASTTVPYLRIVSFALWEESELPERSVTSAKSLFD